MKKTHTAAFKSKVALQAGRGDRSMSEMAAKYEVHPTQIGSWRKVLLAGVGVQRMFSGDLYAKTKQTGSRS